MAALRCTLGDLVVVVSCPIPQNIGLFATVTEVLRDPDDTGDWIIRPQTAMWGYENDGTLTLRADDISAPDDDLRPIRDPGGDAVDETLIYAGDPRVREVQHG